MTLCTFKFISDNYGDIVKFKEYKDNIFQEFILSRKNDVLYKTLPIILKFVLSRDILILKINKIKENDIQYICEQIYCENRFVKFMRRI